jgi:hypothetical protein
VRIHTTALLQQAWQASTRGPEWPPTFEAAQRHPLYSRLLRATACGLAQQQQAAPPLRYAMPARPLHTAMLPTQHQPCDLKRRAAGERDDD